MHSQRSCKHRNSSPCRNGVNNPSALNFFLFACLLLCTLTLSSCEAAKTLAHKGGGGPPAMSVKVIPVQQTSVVEKTRYLATLKSRKAVPLKSQVAGQIQSILVSSGANIAKDTIILKLDPSKQQETVNTLMASAKSYRAEKEAAEATLKSLISTKESKEAAQDFSRRQLDRYSLLFNQGAISREQVDQKNTDLRMAAADVNTAESQIHAQRGIIAKAQEQIGQSNAAIKEQEAQLHYFTIRAPFSGTIGDIPVKVGEYVTSSTLLTTINQNDELEIYINVPTERSADLHPGLKVMLLDANQHSLGEAVISFISPQVNDENQSILVKALYNNSKNTLRSGQLVTAEIIWKQNNGLLVPTESVSMLAGQAFVFVATDQGKGLIAKQVAVDLGEIVGDKYQVLSGLQPTDKVVCSGIQNLVDGIPIALKE